jgi:hypothetical protein
MTKSASNLFLDFDIYGQPIQFSMKGQMEYKTELGGFFSVVSFVVLMLLILAKFLELLTMADAELSLTVQGVDLTDNTSPEVINLASLGLAFAIKKLDDRIGTVNLQHVTEITNGEIILNRKQISLIDCDQTINGAAGSYASYIGKMFANRQDLASSYLCPDASAVDDMLTI